MQQIADRSSEELAAYEAAIERAFRLMRRIATQLGGFALLDILRPSERGAQILPLTSIEGWLEETEDALMAVRPPAASAHCHHHLLEALAGLRQAMLRDHRLLLRARQESDAQMAEERLATAIDHLRHASNALPGMAMVELNSACCASHMSNEQMPPMQA